MSTATAAVNASMVPSTQRSIPLARRSDLVVKRIEYKGISSFVIKDPVGLKYHRLQQEQYRTLELLDGVRSRGALDWRSPAFNPARRRRCHDCRRHRSRDHAPGGRRLWQYEGSLDAQ